MSFRITLFLLAACLLPTFSTDANAQMGADQLDTLFPAEVEAARELQRVEKMLLLGPHRKNKNAAGRMRTLRAAVPEVPTYQRKQLFGPAYKNRRIPNVQTDTMAAPKPTRKRLMGPRYKNRSAKSRRQ